MYGMFEFGRIYTWMCRVGWRPRKSKRRPKQVRLGLEDRTLLTGGLPLPVAVVRAADGERHLVRLWRLLPLREWRIGCMFHKLLGKPVDLPNLIHFGTLRLQNLAKVLMFPSRGVGPLPNPSELSDSAHYSHFFIIAAGVPQ